MTWDLVKHRITLPSTYYTSIWLEIQSKAKKNISLARHPNREPPEYKATVSTNRPRCFLFSTDTPLKNTTYGLWNNRNKDKDKKRQGKKVPVIMTIQTTNRVTNTDLNCRQPWSHHSVSFHINRFRFSGFIRLFILNHQTFSWVSWIQSALSEPVHFIHYLNHDYFTMGFRTNMSCLWFSRVSDMLELILTTASVLRRTSGPKRENSA
jgi:hypothetical protein